jgi:DNA-binding protein
MDNQNIVYIGRKPVMAYTLAVMTALKGTGNEVTLMARGRSISKAVDVAEVVRNQFISDLEVKEIEISTDEVENDDGTTRNISNIAITLCK